MDEAPVLPSSGRVPPIPCDARPPTFTHRPHGPNRLRRRWPRSRAHSTYPHPPTMAATDTRKAVVGDNSEVELQLRLLNENVAHLAELLQELVLATTRSEQVTVPPPLVLEQCPDGQHDWVQQSYTLRPDGTLTDQKQVICKNCGRHATYADRVGVTDDG